MTRKALTQDDVARLLADPSAAARTETAAKVAADFGGGELSASERQLAEEIFRMMVNDAEVRVREALAEALKECRTVPHDVALSLAKDVETVALPILRYSEILTDADLTEIIRDQDSAKQVAIAMRASVSEDVSDALVDTGNVEAVSSLVSNKGAQISDKTFDKVIDGFGGEDSVQDALTYRPSLPIAVSERLVALVSERLRKELAKRHDLPEDALTDMVLKTREVAILSLSTGSSASDVEALVKELNRNGRLTASIMLRALCMGDITFFEAAVAEKAGVTVSNVRTLINDSGTLGLRTVCTKADIPLQQMVAIRAAIDVAREMDYDGRDDDRARYSRRMIERVITQYDELGVELESSDLEYLLAKMDSLPSDILSKDAA